ncbi:hypothetical protein GGF40_003186 [Coemansia sp. RSA 1286]|nr:hypothetical protein GGF40_003186 [Coemansia sp. RSA 1286]
MDPSGEYKGILEAVNRAINGDPLREPEIKKDEQVDDAERTMHALFELVKQNYQLTQHVFENTSRTSDSIKGQDQLLTKLHVRQEATTNAVNILVNRIKELETQYTTLLRLVAQNAHALLPSAPPAITPSVSTSSVPIQPLPLNVVSSSASLSATLAMQSSAAAAAANSSTHYAGTATAIPMPHPYANTGVARASMTGSPMSPTSPHNQMGGAQYLGAYGSLNPAAHPSSPSIASSVSNVTDSRAMTPIQKQGQISAQAPMSMHAQFARDLPPEIARIIHQNPWIASLPVEQRTRYVHELTKALKAQQQQQQQRIQKTQNQLALASAYQRQQSPYISYPNVQQQQQSPTQLMPATPDQAQIQSRLQQQQQLQQLQQQQRLQQQQQQIADENTQRKRQEEQLKQRQEEIIKKQQILDQEKERLLQMQNSGSHNDLAVSPELGPSVENSEIKVESAVVSKPLRIGIQTTGAVAQETSQFTATTGSVDIAQAIAVAQALNSSLQNNGTFAKVTENAANSELPTALAESIDIKPVIKDLHVPVSSQPDKQLVDVKPSIAHLSGKPTSASFMRPTILPVSGAPSPNSAVASSIDNMMPVSLIKPQFVHKQPAEPKVSSQQQDVPKSQSQKAAASEKPTAANANVTAAASASAAENKAASEKANAAARSSSHQIPQVVSASKPVAKSGSSSVILSKPVRAAVAGIPEVKAAHSSSGASGISIKNSSTSSASSSKSNPAIKRSGSSTASASHSRDAEKFDSRARNKSLDKTSSRRISRDRSRNRSYSRARTRSRSRSRTRARSRSIESSRRRFRDQSRSRSSTRRPREMTIKGAKKHMRDDDDDDDSGFERSIRRRQASPKYSSNIVAFSGNNGSDLDTDDDEDNLISRASSGEIEFGIVGASAISSSRASRSVSNASNIASRLGPRYQDFMYGSSRSGGYDHLSPNRHDGADDQSSDSHGHYIGHSKSEHETEPRTMFDSEGYAVTADVIDEMVGPFFFIASPFVFQVYRTFYGRSPLKFGVSGRVLNNFISETAGFKFFSTYSQPRGQQGINLVYFARCGTKFNKMYQRIAKRLFGGEVVLGPLLYCFLLTLSCTTVKSLTPVAVNAMFKSVTGKELDDLTVVVSNKTRRLSISDAWSLTVNWARTLCTSMAKTRGAQDILDKADKCYDEYVVRCKKNGYSGGVLDASGETAREMMDGDIADSRRLIGIRSSDLRPLYRYLGFMMIDYIDPDVEKYLRQVARSFIDNAN